MTAHSLRRWQTLHRWSSLFCTLNLALLCVTGLLLIFHPEIDRMLGSLPEIEAAGQKQLPLQQLVQAGKDAMPGWNPMIFAEDEDHPGRVFVSMAPPGDKDYTHTKPVIINAYTGKPADVNLDETFSAIVLKLHANLFAGFAGEMYLALVGLAFFLALVSGAVLYAPFMRNILFGMLRRERGKRLFQLDLHNFIGIATLLWCSVVALTGIILELSRPILLIYQFSDLAAMTAPYKSQPPPATVVPLEKAFESAQAAWPGHRVQFAIFPGSTLSGEHHYTFFMAAEKGIAKRVPKLALVNAETGGIDVARPSPWYVQALFVSGPLHFGDYAGLPLRIIWALFTVLTLVLCVSGIYLWVARLRGRRKDKETPITSVS